MPVIFFLTVILSIALSLDTHNAWLYAERKLALVAMPLAFIFFRFKSMAQYFLVLKTYIISIGIGGLYCLVHACVLVYRSGNAELFFYHSFAKPLNISAIYFAVYCLFALILIFYYKEQLFAKTLRIVLSGFLSMILVLLASKMVLGLWLVFIAYFFFKTFRVLNYNRGILVTLILTGLVAGMFAIPFINKRFRDEINSNMEVVKAKNYRYDTPFSGLSLRLVFIKYSVHILNEKNAWIAGVGTGDFQQLLNTNYINTGLYTGPGVDGDRGYLNYNPHNQYIEILLAMGISGLFVFIFWQFSLLREGIKKREPLLLFIVMIFLCLCISECFLSANKGIVWFLFFSCLFVNNENHNKEALNSM